jgi:rfaE bifunctional protein kinase chain/domain
MSLENFKNARLLVVGDVMLDRYWWGSVSRISPEAPVPIVKLERETHKPGGAANVAANAVALGAKVGLVGMVGEDRDAEALDSALAAFNLVHRLMVPSASRRTIVKTRIVAHGQHVARLDSEDVSDVDDTEADALLSEIRVLAGDNDLIIISDYGKGLISDAVAREIISTARSNNVPVLADPKGKHFEKYAGATVLTPNRREAAEACKIEESDPRLVAKAGEQLLNVLGLDNVLITESENGMTLFQREQGSVHFDAAAQEVYDVTGAGDTVIACLGVAAAAGFSMVDSARLANLAAGLSVQHLGTVAVSIDDLRAAIDANSEEHPRPASAS